MPEPTLLLCEDDPQLRRIFAKHLTKAGYSVIEAPDGKAALDAMEQASVSLVLTDLMMPHVDGMELCRRLKAHPRWSGIPVIMLTARDSTEAQVEGLDCGADDYLTKPVPPAILLARVRVALRRSGGAKPAGEATRFGGLTLRHSIGSGTFGEVYLAHDERLGRDVAVKVIREQFSQSEDARARFRRESEAMCAVRHPSVVTVHAVGEQEGRPYIVMEHLTGGDLNGRLQREHHLPVPEAIGMARQVADALAALHRAGITHRDIKPENILFDGAGRPVLVDFGIALMTTTTRMTMEGSLLGTLFYMAPEQFDGRTVDGRTDLYSLGVVMYESICGAVPIKADTPQAMMYNIVWQQPRPIEERGVPVDPKVAAVIMRLLAKAPEGRYQTAEEVVGALAGL